MIIQSLSSMHRKLLELARHCLTKSYHSIWKPIYVWEVLLFICTRGSALIKCVGSVLRYVVQECMKEYSNNRIKKGYTMQWWTRNQFLFLWFHFVPLSSFGSLFWVSTCWWLVLQSEDKVTGIVQLSDEFAYYRQEEASCSALLSCKNWLGCSLWAGSSILIWCLPPWSPNLKWFL